MRFDRLACWLALFGAGALCACYSVKLSPPVGDAHYAAKPKGCSLDFLYDVPKRPYQEIAHLEEHVTNPPSGGNVEVLRDKACELGADAVIVTRNFVTNALGHALVGGTAIKYVERGQPTEEEQQPEGEKAPGSTNL